jgi:OFA family oxalate/formate antiporter-like MFS transporter
VAQGVILLIVAQTLHAPVPGTILPATTSAAVPQSARSYTSMEVLRSPAFWVLYLMFVLVSASGLMATAQLAPIARDFGLSSTAILFGATTLSVALVVDNVMNGLARPFFGAVSDRIGREYTMALAFILGALSYWLLALYGYSPWAFVICAALIFFTWGEIFSLFPSTCTDLFGTRYATANSMMLYTAKGTSAFLVPLANVLKATTGSWEAVFLVAAGMNLLVVVLALLVLLPIRVRHHQQLDSGMGAGQARG